MESHSSGPDVLTLSEATLNVAASSLSGKANGIVACLAINSDEGVTVAIKTFTVKGDGLTSGETELKLCVGLLIAAHSLAVNIGTEIGHLGEEVFDEALRKFHAVRDKAVRKNTFSAEGAA